MPSHRACYPSLRRKEPDLLRAGETEIIRPVKLLLMPDDDTEQRLARLYDTSMKLYNEASLRHRNSNKET